MLASSSVIDKHFNYHISRNICRSSSRNISNKSEEIKCQIIFRFYLIFAINNYLHLKLCRLTGWLTDRSTWPNYIEIVINLLIRLSIKIFIFSEPLENIVSVHRPTIIINICEISSKEHVDHRRSYSFAWSAVGADASGGVY